MTIYTMQTGHWRVNSHSGMALRRFFVDFIADYATGTLELVAEDLTSIEAHRMVREHNATLVDDRHLLDGVREG